MLTIIHRHIIVITADLGGSGLLVSESAGGLDLRNLSNRYYPAWWHEIAQPLSRSEAPL
jgi:hypothetical protein